MKQALLPLSLALASACAALDDPAPVAVQEESRSGPVQKITPLLSVDEIESSLGFWSERLGFEVLAQVPDEGPLAFAMLGDGALELMLQTHASVEADDPRLAAELRAGTTCLYLEVEDLDLIEERLEGVEIVVPRRQTFYGAHELFVRTPGNHVVGFAQIAAVEGE